MHLLSLLRQLLITAGFVVAWLWALGQIIRVIYPEDDDAPVDTYRSASPLVSDAPSVVLYEFDRLARPAERRMIVIGSSSAMLNLRADHLREDFPGWDVHNLAIPTSNVDQVLQVFELVAAVSDEETMARTVFVLPIYYVIFAMPEALWNGKNSPLSTEMLRYGLYRARAGTTPAPILGYRLAGVTRAVSRVFLGVDRLSKAVLAARDDLDAGKRVNWKRFSPAIKQPYGYAKKAPDANFQRSENNRRGRQIGTIGTLEEGQFQRMEELARRVISFGSRLVIIDGVVPTWNRSGHFKFYREHKQSFVAGLSQIPGVDYIDLYDLIPDELFGDSAHTQLKGSEIFEDVVAERLRTLPTPIE